MLLSSIDKRSYRNIVLKNRLQCLLVSDPETEKSSACCDVQVGSLSDPLHAQGLAHFLEHMLFLGTEKYPIENSYSAFLNSHGGYSNAYTSQENTVYYFDVQNDAFEEALDMFASFFTCPLFTEASTAREINAVDSENKKNLQSDSWRKYQLLKSLAREGHPISKFSTGNLQTLGEAPKALNLNIRDLMIEFHKKYYSANMMKLVLYGNRPLDAMETWAENMFSSIPNKDLTRQAVPGDAYGREQVGKCLELVPIRDVKKVEVYFPIPPIEHLYLTKPTRYLSHLLGHESDGSILSLLKSRGWAQGLSAFASPSLQDLAFLGVSVELSEDGLRHIDEIVEVVFAYIGLLKREGVLSWVWEELQATAAMQFRFLNPVDPSDYATQLANSMHKYPVEHLLAGDILLFEKDLPAVESFLQHLVPSNALVIVHSKAFQGSTRLKETWYGTDYNLGDMSAEQLSLWETALKGDKGDKWKALHLPQPNLFVPTVFDLKNPFAAEAKGFSPPRLITVLNDPPSETEAVPEGVVTSSGTQEPESSEGAPIEQEAAEEEEGEDGEESAVPQESATSPPSLSNPPVEVPAVLTWLKGDDVWRVPKGCVSLTLESSLCGISPRTVALTDLLAQLVKEKLSEYSYYADCAGLYYDVQLSKAGLELSFQGYDHKIALLVRQALLEIKRIAGGEPKGKDKEEEEAVSASLFERVKERALLNYKNHLFWQPYYHCLYGSLLCLEEPRWSSQDKYRSLLPVSLRDLLSYAATFLANVKAEVHGNFLKADAEEFSVLVKDTLGFEPLPLAQAPIRRCVDLTPGLEVVFRQSSAETNPAEVNSAVENLYVVCPAAVFGSEQSEVESACVALAQLMFPASASSAPPTTPSVQICVEVLLELLTHMMSEPAFDQLRTKEQLGYIVFSGIKKLGQVLAVQVIVQSGHKGPNHLDERVEAFLTQYRQTELAAYSAADPDSSRKLEGFRAAVCEKLTEKPKNIDQESARYWEEIKSGGYLFDRKKQLAAALQGAALPDLLAALLALFDGFILNTSSRRKFSSQFFGKDVKGVGRKEANKVVVRDAGHFKRSARLLKAQAVQEGTLKKLENKFNSE